MIFASEKLYHKVNKKEFQKTFFNSLVKLQLSKFYCLHKALVNFTLDRIQFPIFISLRFPIHPRIALFCFLLDIYVYRTSVRFSSLQSHYCKNSDLK
jgi:hypothetical protein